MPQLKKLNEIPLNVPVRIANLSAGQFRGRLIEMGLYKGQEVEIKLKAPLNDPIAVKTGNCTVMLRLDEASEIEVEQI